MDWFLGDSSGLHRGTTAFWFHPVPRLRWWESHSSSWPWCRPTLQLLGMALLYARIRHPGCWALSRLDLWIWRQWGPWSLALWTSAAFSGSLVNFWLEFFYVTLKHANSLRQCRPIEDLDRLQLRFGIWRSLPFAAMTFALSLRSILELTLCTAPATLSVIGQGLQVNNTLEWTKAIRDNDITVERLTRFQAFREDMNMSGVGDAELQEFREKFASLHDSLVGAFWKSCHCYKSKWKLKTGTFRGRQIPLDGPSASSWQKMMMN